MSSPRQRHSPTFHDHGPPYVGALLRLTWQIGRRRMLEALVNDGFADLNDAHLNVLQYPAPDGVRPRDLALRARMTKQAMNHLLAQLKSLGYIERRPQPGSTRRLVYLTRRAWRAAETMWTTQRQLEAEWAEFLGRKRFEEFLGTLRELSSLESSGDARSADASGRLRGSQPRAAR